MGKSRPMSPNADEALTKMGFRAENIAPSIPRRTIRVTTKTTGPSAIIPKHAQPSLSTFLGHPDTFAQPPVLPSYGWACIGRRGGDQTPNWTEYTDYSETNVRQTVEPRAGVY